MGASCVNGAGDVRAAPSARPFGGSKEFVRGATCSEHRTYTGDSEHRTYTLFGAQDMHKPRGLYLSRGSMFRGFEFEDMNAS